MIVDSYRIYWRYTDIEVSYHGSHKPIKQKGKSTRRAHIPLRNRIVTRIECFIVNKKTKQELAHSWVQPHHTDIYDKEKGRKLTLAKALTELTALDQTQGGAAIESARKFRGKVWEAYRTLTPKPRW